MSAGAVSGLNEAGTSQSQDTGRLRILQVSGSAAGGVRAHLADCARILASDGHDVIVEAPVSVLDGLDVAPARAEALEIGPRPRIGDTLAVARLRRLGGRAHAVPAQYRAERDELIDRLRADEPKRWSYTALAQALGCSRELIAQIVRRRR